MKRLLILTVLAAAPSRPAGAQDTAVIVGTVADTLGQPLRGTVRADGGGRPVVADGRGHYRLGVPAGRVILHVTHIGFRPIVDTVTVAAGDSLERNYLLPAAAVELQPTIVTAAKRSQLLDRAVTSVVLVSDSDLAHRAVATVDEAVNRAPGVLFLNGQVNIRGSSGFVEGLGSRVLLLVDGVPANQGDRGGIDWDMVPLAQVERVEVVKGAGSSLYGSSAFGGVVNLITHEIPVGWHGRVRATGGAYANPPADAWRFRDYTGGLGGLDVTGSYGTEAVRGSLTLGGRHSDGYREQDRSDQWETAGKAEWLPQPGTRVTASGSWTSHQYQVGDPWCELNKCDNRGLAFQPFMIDTSNQGNYTRSDKGYVAATIERTPSARFSWQARGSWLRTDFTDLHKGPDDFGVANRFGAELRGEAHAARGGVVTVGAEASYSDVTSNIFTGVTAATSDTVRSHDQTAFAAYGEGEHQAGRVRLTAGAREGFIARGGGSGSSGLSPRGGAGLPPRAGAMRGPLCARVRAAPLARAVAFSAAVRD